ncbi:hypothetical protein [Paludibacterium paludis]|uniref:Uncharacterized protein n=1 Tax=Paludibacterium paludis TaxID=1225769 RepID=A0A918U7U5_9NEIS|nr:hypothetical protein [Paludibacterium paludis]GGY07129.1 hypothetical protein GCM10011289_07170 [Paludibacterium paludis]
MADLMDVQDALKTLVNGALYPAGPAAVSAAGMPVTIDIGMPAQAQLDTDLAAQRCHVAIFSLENERNTTRFSKTWRTLKRADITVKAEVAGLTISLSGSTATAHNIMVIADNTARSVAIKPGGRLVDAVAALAAQFPGAAASGASLTLPAPTRRVIARVGGFDTVSRDLCHIEKDFAVTILAANQDQKRALARLLMPRLVDTRFLVMPDGSRPKMLYRRSLDSDGAQNGAPSRRDIVMTVEYAITQLAEAAQVLSVTETLSPGAGPVAASKVF